MSTDTARQLLESARGRGVILATAESCTGGRVAQAITAVPGASDAYWGGIVAYDNHVKHAVLGVPRETLETHGAVSAQTARAMARGACRLIGAGYAVATTGIAGPGGGSAEKPVGLVYFAVATPEGTAAVRHEFKGDRGTVQALATETALRLLLDALNT